MLGGKQIKMTKKSPIAKLTINIFVIVFMCEFLITTITTSKLPIIPSMNTKIENVIRKISNKFIVNVLLFKVDNL